ncbi:MAG: formate dehydrogenase accessory sulfurtransferase FdhD [Syntrophomonadaceae bacterium]
MPAARLIDERTTKIYDRGQFRTVSDALVVEVSIKLILNGSELAVLACSPEAFEELTVGYLLSEGIIADYNDLAGIQVKGENVYIELRNRNETMPGRGYISSCSGKRLPGDYNRPDLIQAGFEQRFSAANLLSLIGQLDEKSATFRRTGGVHSAALGQGSSLLFRYEDIGRHNAVDKVLGKTFIKRIPPADKCLVLSGRIAWEIVWKAAQSHIPLIISRSAPTFKAVEWAQHLGLTIVGFARGERFNLYSHWERVES